MMLPATLTEDVGASIARAVDTFGSSPSPGTSVMADCGPFNIMKGDAGVYVNLEDTDVVFPVHGMALRRPMDCDYLCFASDDFEVCFPIETDGDYGADGFPAVGTAPAVHTTDVICDTVCAGIYEPDGKTDDWVRTSYANGKVCHSVQINHGACVTVYEDGAELYLSDEDESFKILAVEGYNARSCMPGLHVITEEGVVFYFRTLGEETTDGGEQ